MTYLLQLLYSLKTTFDAGRLILRMDGGYGSVENICKLKSIPNLKFVVKAFSTIQSKNLAKDIPLKAYTQVDDSSWVYELPFKEEGILKV